MLRNMMGQLFLLLMIDFKITCEFRGNQTDSNVVADYSQSQCSYEIIVPENTPVGDIIFTLPHCQSNETTNATSRKPMPTETSSPTRLTFENVSIIDGNKNERFKVASDTGDISVVGYLDSNIDGKYILTVLIETVQITSQFLCTVTIILEDVDGWPPYYNETCEMPTREPRKVEIPTFIAFFYGHSKVPFEVVLPHFYEAKFKGDINNDQCKLTIYCPIHVWYSSLNLDLRGSDYELKVLGVGNLEVAFSLYHEKAQFPSDSFYDEEWFNPIHVTHSGPYALLKTVVNNINTKLLSVPIKWTLQVRKQQVSSGEGWIDYIGCPDGKYGFRCNKPCICKNDARCNVFNGACKCKSGWQGPACDIPTSCIEIHPKQQQLVYGSLLILTCTTHNIILPSENDEWKSRISWSLNGEYLNHHTLNFTKDGFNVEERMLGISILQTERGVTEKTAGHYKCEATDEYNNLFVATATVTTKCPENVFGQYCNISCDCAPAWSASCHRYRGCVCYPGFSGKHCEIDTTPPIFKECPQDMTNFVKDDGNLKATNVTWIVPTVKDNSENVTLYSNYTPGDVFQIGTTVVQYTALDSAKNTAYCTFKVNVLYGSPSRTSLIIGILVLCTCMFVLLPLFFCLGYRYRLQLYTVLTGDMDADYSNDGKDCDAFVLFSSRDVDFAETIAEHLEGNGTYRLLLHHRDFIGGKAIFDNIEDCFETSRSSILVISPNFLESGMCEHEARIALDNWINRRQRLIPIVKGDIKLVNDSKVIKRIVGLINYIQWPKNGSDKEEEMFWKKLEKALKMNVRKQSRIGLIKRCMLTLCRGLKKGYSRVPNNDV